MTVVVLLKTKYIYWQKMEHKTFRNVKCYLLSNSKTNWHLLCTYMYMLLQYLKPFLPRRRVNLFRFKFSVTDNPFILNIWICYNITASNSSKIDHFYHHLLECLILIISPWIVWCRTEIKISHCFCTLIDLIYFLLLAK